MIPSFPLSLLRLRQGFGLQRRPGLPYLPQPALTEGQFLRQLIPTLVPAVTVVLVIVHLPGLPQQLRHLRLQLRFLLLHAPVAHRLIPGGVGPHLGPVQGHMAQLHQSRLLTQRQHLQEQAPQRLQMVLAKVGDGAEVGSVVGRQHPEADVLVETLGNATGGGHPGAVAVEQHLDHHPGVIGWPAPPFLFVADRDGREVQLVHHVGDEVGQVLRRQPLLQGRWQQ